MMKRQTIATAVIFAIAAPAPVLAATWQDVRSICSESEAACGFYIRGVIDAVLYANQEHVCLAGNALQGDAVESITATADMIPHLWATLDAYEIVYAWLAGRYPCNAAAGPVNPILDR